MKPWTGQRLGDHGEKAASVRQTLCDPQQLWSKMTEKERASEDRRQLGGREKDSFSGPCIFSRPYLKQSSPHPFLNAAVLHCLSYKRLSTARQSRRVNPWINFTEASWEGPLFYLLQMCTHTHTLYCTFKQLCIHVLGNAPNLPGSHLMMTMATVGVGKTLLGCM